MKNIIALLIVSGVLFSCKKKEEDPQPTATATTTTGGTTSGCPTCNFPDTVWNSSASGPKLVFKFKFDSTQVRLNNLGQPTSVGAGNAAYSPVFNFMSSHYIELAQNDLSPIGQGPVLYHAPETTCGGSVAIIHCQSVMVKNNEVLFSIPIASVTAGTYKWLRISLAYQNYDIKIKTTSAGIINGTIASFVGFRTWVTKYKMHGVVMTPTVGVAGNNNQGYWGFYTKVFGIDYFADGQAPATTVVNPNSANIPTPNGSCLVQGEFVSAAAPTVGSPLVITGSETSDIIITISLSTNKSFEWNEITADGYFQPEIGEKPVDMGIRGMIPIHP
jgi:hypothetical protein